MLQSAFIWKIWKRVEQKKSIVIVLGGVFLGTMFFLFIFLLFDHTTIRKSLLWWEQVFIQQHFEASALLPVPGLGNGNIQANEEDSGQIHSPPGDFKSHARTHFHIYLAAAKQRV